MLLTINLPIDDIEQIFIVLGALYVIECCWWLRGESVSFYTWPANRWSNLPSENPRPLNWRLTWANPWPGGQSFVSERFPCPFDEHRLLVPKIDSNTGNESFVAYEYESLEPIKTKNSGVISGDILIGEFSSQALANSVAKPLECLRVAEPGKRKQIVEESLADRWSYTKAHQRLSGWKKKTSMLRWFGSMLIVHGLIIGLLVYEFRGSLPLWLPEGVFISFLLNWLTTAMLGLHLSSGQSASEQSASIHRLIPFLSPVSAMRVTETSGRDILASFEPLLAALVTSDDYGLDSAVAFWFRDTIYPTQNLSAEPDKKVVETLQVYQQKCKDLANGAIRSAGFDPVCFLKAPSVEDDALAYCPRCRRTFREHIVECFYCGLKVQPIDYRDPERAG